ncbi:MAG TPA: efflux RND transporter periplasmic adaptor subunit [Terriglobales bacterium]|nr:efflux RND transporter periplasmic adaptor subunit [Terriglobales bacterium]
MLKSTLYVPLILTSLLVLAGCADRGNSTVSAAPAPTAAPDPAPAPVASVSNVFTVSGPLIVEHQLDVLAQRDGVVAKLLADTGSRVHAGDLLAQLDDRQLQADLEAARAKTRSTEADLKNWEAEARVLQADFDRAQKMWEAQLITREQWEHAKFKAEADQWDVKRVEQLLLNCKEVERSLELELEKARIRAPFSGIVARRYVREGQQVSKGDRLFWVTAEAPLRMRFTLPEKLLGTLKRGQQLPITIPDLPNEDHMAKVIELSPVVDPTSGTFDGLVEVTGAAGSLRPGMSAILRIEPRP